MAALLDVISQAVGENWPAAIALAFVIYIVTQFLLAYFKHRSDRRAYQYERSAQTGIQRFQKETEHIEKLSSVLLQLVEATRAMCPKEMNPCFNRTLIDAWYDAYKLSIERIGAAAPFLNYIDLESGAYSCGVAKTCKENCNHSLESQIDSLKRRLDSDDAKSLYTRAALIIDACVIRVYNEYEAVNQNITLESICSPLDNTLPIATILPFSLLKEHKDYLKHANDLSTRYEHFVNCAYCRLRDCETGSRDARKQRVKDWLANIWKKPLSPIYHYFDPRCPYS